MSVNNVVISELIQLLTTEEKTKPGVMSSAGELAEKKCAQALRLYFRKVTAQLRGRLISLHNLTNKSVARHSAEIAARSVVRRNSTQLSDILKKHIAAAMLKADKQEVFHEAAKRKEDVSANVTANTDKLGLSGAEAAEYASESAAEAVTGINQTTVERFADAVGEAIEGQLGVGGLSRLLRDISSDMSTARADMIAATEIADAFGEAAIRKLTREGIAYKQLIPSPGACPICLSIIADGPIPVDEDFEDDDGETYDRSPIHPNCRCATVGARAPEEEE